MGKLIVNDAGGSVRAVGLNKERITVGRHADNDICLNDKAVSGHHAVLITILSDSFLEDLDSTNGTLVNSKQIAKHPLLHGDTITIGRNTLRYEAEQVGEAGEYDDFEKTMILRPRQVAGMPSGETINGRLRVQSGSNTGKELVLTKALTTVGKPGVQVAAITKRADGYYIVNVGGAEGGGRPLVNGAEIGALARKLNADDLIELAGVKMVFLLS